MRNAAIAPVLAALATAGCGGEKTDAEIAAAAAEDTAARVGAETLRRDEVRVSDATCTKAPDEGPAFWRCRVPVENLVIECTVRVTEDRTAGSNCRVPD